MTAVASPTHPRLAAKLTAEPAPNYAGDHLTRWTLTINGEAAFQDVDQWGNPYDGSPSSDLYDNLCEVLERVCHLNAAALSTL